MATPHMATLTPLARTLDICRQCGINPDPCQIWAGIVRRHIEGAVEDGKLQGRLEENAACELEAKRFSCSSWTNHEIAIAINNRRRRLVTPDAHAVRDELDKPKRHAVGYPT